MFIVAFPFPLESILRIYISEGQTNTYMHIQYVYSGLSIPCGCPKPLHNVRIHNTCTIVLLIEVGPEKVGLQTSELNVYDRLISWGMAVQGEGVASPNDLLP